MSKTSSSTTTEVKMGVVRYLQLYPQNSGIAAILKARYKSQIKTKSEWDALVESIKNKKVSS